MKYKPLCSLISPQNNWRNHSFNYYVYLQKEKRDFMQDLFTIALPVYKRTDYIRKALDSAVNQTVKCRILLIDNNSPHDDFKTIVESYNNPLIKYIKTSETVPQDENFNNCIRYCETPWLTILHDDDILHCQYVEMAQKNSKTIW